MALHVRGVVLPDDEVRDLWLVGDRVTFEPVPRRGDRLTAAGSCPDWSTATATSASPRAASPTGPRWSRPSSTGTPACCAIRDAGSPYPYPSCDDDRETCPDWPGPAGTSPGRRYLRDIGVEVRPAELVADGEGAGRGRQRLGQAGRRLDRPRRRRPGAVLGPDDVLAAAVAAAHAAGARVAVHTFGEESVAALVAGRRGLGRARHRTVRRTIDEMARRGTALVPDDDQYRDRSGRSPTQREEKFPGYARHMLALRDRFPARGRRGPRGRRADLRRHRRWRRDRARPGGRGDAAAARRPDCPADGRCCAAGSWGAREWLGLPRPGRGRRWPTWWSTTPTRAPT